MINRPLQHEVLIKMRDVYPAKLSSTYSEYEYANSLAEIKFNVAYLEELGLIRATHAGHYAMTLMDGPPLPPDGKAFVNGFITASGIDFLEKDGGISAILGTVTVRFHADTIRSLIDAKIAENNAIPPQEKAALRKALSSMREEGLKQMTTRLIALGFDKGAMTLQQIKELIPLDGG